jgi:hypothetical protein
MRRFVSFTLATAALLVLGAGSAAAADPAVPPQDDPQQAAEAWLALVDAGDYAGSWDEAAEMFKAQVPQEQWVDQMTQVRAPAGAVESRELSGSDPMSDPPGAPAGEYVQLRFRSTFAQFGAANEVVVVYADGDRGWRVAGYFVQP